MEVVNEVVLRSTQPAAPHMQANFQSQVMRTMVRNQTHPTHPHRFISKVKKRERSGNGNDEGLCRDPEEVQAM